MMKDTIRPDKSAIHNRPEYRNFYRMLMLVNPAYEHSSQEFRNQYGHSDCAIFAKAISRELTLAKVPHSITGMLQNGSNPVHWYVNFHCNKTNEEAFIDAYGITFNEKSIHNRYGLDPDEDATTLVSFKIGEVSCDAADFRNALESQMPTGLSSTGIGYLFDQIVIDFADHMMETLATDTTRQSTLYEALFRETNAYKLWLKRQEWFRETDTKKKQEMLETLDNLLRGLKRKSRLLKPNVLWERAVDHWMSTDLENDQGPTSWQWIYSTIDQYRTSVGVTCSR